MARPERIWLPSSRGALYGLLLVLLVWPKISLFYPLMIDSWGAKNYEVAALDELRRTDRDLFRVASVLDLQPAYAYAQGFEAADGWANLYPGVYRELWLRVLDPLFAALPLNRDIFDPVGRRPQDHYIFLGTGLLTPGIGRMPGEDPAQAIRDGFDIDRRFNLHLLSLLNVKYLLSEYPLKSRALHLVHAASPPPSVPRYREYAGGLLIGPRPSTPGPSVLWRGSEVLADLHETIERKRRGKDVYIYENAWVIPRYRFVSKLVRARSGNEVLDRLAGMTADELRSTAVLEDPAAEPFGPPVFLSGGEVRLDCYTPDVIRLVIRNPGPGFLVIANTWNPYWTARVDGRARRLLRTNHAQFGLPTGPGEREVVLRYAPPYAPHVLITRLRAAFGAMPR